VDAFDESVRLDDAAMRAGRLPESDVVFAQTDEEPARGRRGDRAKRLDQLILGQRASAPA
jgi:hypothetical protein